MYNSIFRSSLLSFILDLLIAESKIYEGQFSNKFQTKLNRERFKPPCTDYIFYVCSTVHYWANSLVHFGKCSKGPPLISDNNWHQYWIHFAVLCIYLPKTKIPLGNVCVYIVFIIYEISNILAYIKNWHPVWKILPLHIPSSITH